MTEIPFIVSAHWLSEHLNDRQVVIVDCRFSLADTELGQQQYQTSHIPGAVYLHLNRDLSSPVSKHGGRHPLPNTRELAEKLGNIGINSGETLVIAYDDSRFGFSARLWWLLRYLGHDRVALLDGGWKSWVAGGYPVTDTIPTPVPGKFTPEVRSDWVVDIDTVKTRKDLPEVVLVDSRESYRYRGEKEPIDPIAGCILGAVNYPWQDVTDEQGMAYPPEAQKRRWSGVENAAEIMVYCGSGVTACVNLFSLEMSGIHSAKLYAGSWSDWCSYLV